MKDQELLSVTIIKYNVGSTNGPVWAIWYLDKDTIIVKFKDASAVFHLDMNISYSTFQIHLKSNLKPVFVKLNNKLYKINNLVTSLENPEEQMDFGFYSNNKMLYLTPSYAATGNLKIYTSEGKLAMIMDSPPESLSLESLDKGIYLVSLTYGKTIVRRNIFIEYDQ